MSARWWNAVGALLFLAACAAAFAAYLRPDMLVAFGDILSYCASLLK